MPVTEDTKSYDNLGGFTSYKQKYSSMKSKLKAILYENELFQDELRKLQRELLDIYRDKETLLEQVIQYEDFDSSSSDSESQTSDIACEVDSDRAKLYVESTEVNIKPKVVSTSKRRNTSLTLNVIPAKGNDNGNISYDNTGTMSSTNGDPSKVVNLNDNKNGTVVSKTDSQSISGGDTNSIKTACPVKQDTNTSGAKPKAPRSRSKAATSSNKNGSTKGPSKANAGKIQKQTAANQPNPPTAGKQNATSTGPKPKPPSRSRSKAANNNSNKNGSAKTNSKANTGKNQKQTVVSQQNPPMTVISRVPITTNQINLVQQVTTVESAMTGNLMPIQTIGGQPSQSMNYQYQHHPQIIQHHQMHHQQQTHHIPDPQTTLALGIDNSQQHQQPIMTTQSNQNFDQGYTIVSSDNPGNLIQSQQAPQLTQVMAIHQTPQAPQLTQVMTIHQTPQGIHIINPQQRQQQHPLHPHLHHHHHPQQQQTPSTHQGLTPNGHLMRLQTQTMDEGVNVGTDQVNHTMNQGCFTPQGVLDSLSNPGQQQHQQQQSSLQQQQSQHQHQLQTAQQNPSSNQISEQNQQDLNQQHQHQQQQQHNNFSTQPLATGQLSAEELEQHLESRRMEQASLLLPDWESIVPSEIFCTDSAIKFMAED